MPYKSFLFKLFAVASTWTIFCCSAYADSFCGFDTGLIGTKAIGYAHPGGMETHKYETEICELNIYDDSSEDASSPIIRLCTDFKHVSSGYVNGYEEKGFSPLGSDYFYLQVFDARENWAQIALKSGEKKWVKSKHVTPFAFPYHYREDNLTVTIDYHHPTQALVFKAPKLNEPDPYFGRHYRTISDSWLDQDGLLSFYRHPLFTLLEKYGFFNRRHIEERTLATNYPDLFGIHYSVKSIIKDDEGREWLEAHEHLEILNLYLPEMVEDNLKQQGKSLSEEERDKLRKATNGQILSDPVRTVYFPYREPSGVITMVMTDGPNCD